MPKYNVRLCAVVRVKLAEPVEAENKLEAVKKAREILDDSVLRDVVDRVGGSGSVADYVEYDDTVTEAIVDESENPADDFACFVPNGENDDGNEHWVPKKGPR